MVRSLMEKDGEGEYRMLGGMLNFKFLHCMLQL